MPRKENNGDYSSTLVVVISIFIYRLSNIMTVESYSTYLDMWHCIQPSAFWAPSSTCKGVMLIL